MQIQQQVDLQPLHSLRLRARAEAFCTVTSLAELNEALDWCRHRGVAPVVMGEGTNIIPAPEVPGLVIHMAITGRRVLQRGAQWVEVELGAGESLHASLAWLLAEGCYGLENLAWIPGTVGAAPVQNVGAYGVEIAPYILAVQVVEVDTGKSQWLDQQACEFAYRHSVFKTLRGAGWIIVAVRLRLRAEPAVDLGYPALASAFAPDAHPSPLQVFEAVIAIRKARLPDPKQWPNVGSFFKNPVVVAGEAQDLQARFPTMPQFAGAPGETKLSAAWLIEHCGWRGRREGHVGMHPQHALVLYTDGGADAPEVFHWAERIRYDVHQTFGVALEIEPRSVGC